MSKTVLQHAEAYCLTHKHRLTEPRLAVLKIILSNSKPLGAYEILEKLGQTIKNPKPPTVYRAIEFWKEHGFIHRIDSLNAYTACEAGHLHKGSQFMICDDCGDVIEIHLCHLPQPFKESLEKKSFVPLGWNLEVHGLCAACSR